MDKPTNNILIRIDLDTMTSSRFRGWLGGILLDLTFGLLRCTTNVLGVSYSGRVYRNGERMMHPTTPPPPQAVAPQTDKSIPY